jgi:predicted Fe-Mo cluster-binding NifX family protein
MSKVGFLTLLPKEDSALSPHFGKAKWVLVRDGGTSKITVEQNTALSGHAVVDILQRHACTDVVFTEIGPGAFRHLQEAGIRGWLAPANLPIPQLIERFDRGQLSRVTHHTHSPDVYRERPGRPCNGPDAQGHGARRACCGEQQHESAGKLVFVQLKAGS